MRIIPAETQPDFRDCLKHALGSPVVITQDGRVTAAMIRVHENDLDELLLKYYKGGEHVGGAWEGNPSDAAKSGAGLPSEAGEVSREERDLIDEPDLFGLYLKLRPHLVQEGCRVYVTDTPDLRARIPQRKRANVYALVKVRRGHLLLYVCVGKKNIKPPLEADDPFNAGKSEDIWFGAFRLFPKQEIPDEVLQCIAFARKNLAKR